MIQAAAMRRAAFRSLRLLDIPALAAKHRFDRLRREYYADLWPKVALELGADCEDWGDGWQRLIWHGLALLVRGPDLRLDDHLTLRLMGDKRITHRLLAEQGFEVPRYTAFTLRNLGEALRLMAETGSIVVKPASGTAGGNGITTAITEAKELRRAAWAASKFDPDLLAEEHLEGHSYRLLYLDGQLIDAIRRDPPRVFANGRDSIRALVAAENRARLVERPFIAMSPLRIDQDARQALAIQGLTPASVSASGEAIVVKRVINQNNRFENHCVTSQVHPATRIACAGLLANLGVRLAGIDIIAKDISARLDRENGLISEINTTPALHHHDLVATPSAGRSVAAEVASRLFRSRAAVVILPRRPLKSLAGHRVAAE